MIAHFPNADVLYERVRLPVMSGTLGIITQDLVTPMERAGDVQVAPLHDAPRWGDHPKDGTYKVADNWVLYMKTQMTQKAFEWWIVNENTLMINRPSKWGSGWPWQQPMFENIALPCNFVELDDFRYGHARVVSRSSVNFDTSTLDPAKDNWFYKPTQFWKATRHVPSGKVYLVGSELHVYTPVIKQKPEIWLNTKRIELFPTLPMPVTYKGVQYIITGYCLRGASVYGHAAEMDIPLRLARVPGECEHPCPEWRLIEKSVPPETRENWI